MEKVKVQTEKVDDVPLILHIESEMGIGTIINEVIKPHPNRKGLSIGAMIMVWLSYIEDELLNQLKENLPANMKVTILADRGFADTKLMQLLTELGFDYVIRIKKNFYVENPDGICKAAQDWLSDENKAVMVKNAKLTEQKFEIKRFVAVKDKDMKQAWFLVSSLEIAATSIIKLYSKRFTIEEGYRDFKDDRFGMGLSNTSIKSPSRRDRLRV